jgi:hypothetical protein
MSARRGVSLTSTPRGVSLTSAPRGVSLTSARRGVSMMTLGVCIALCATNAPLKAAQALPVPYSAVEVDRFVPARGIDFPTNYQIALTEDIAREVSLAFQTAIVVRQGEPAPYGQALLRISGVVTRFKPGSKIKRQLIGFGAGATEVKTQVWFIDAATGQVLLNREAKGITWTGLAGGDSQAAGDSLAKKIAKFCNSAHLLASN